MRGHGVKCEQVTVMACRMGGIVRYVDDQKGDLVHKRKAGIRNSGRLRMYSTDLSSYVNHDLIAFDEKASGVLFIVSYCRFGSRLLGLYRPCWVHFGGSHARALHLFRAESSRRPMRKGRVLGFSPVAAPGERSDGCQLESLLYARIAGNSYRM